MKFKKGTVLLLLAIIGFASCGETADASKGATIVGAWMIESVDGKELPEAEKMAYIILTEDGKCEQGTDGVCELGGDNTIKGIWKLADNGNLIIENSDGSTSTYTEVSFSEDDMSMMHDVTPITFQRKK